MLVKSTADIVREIFVDDLEINEKISRCLAVFSHRPFNMKGQELEEVLGYYIKDALENKYKIKNVYVCVPQNKKTTDIKFNFYDNEDESRKFDTKFYGAASRFQISTCATILNDIRNKFGSYNNQILNDVDKDWLIDIVKTTQVDYNISFLSFIHKNGDIDINCFDFDKIDISSFRDIPFELKRVAKENRIEIHIKLNDNSYMEISAGGNALNRGIWFNKVKTTSDIEKIYKTGFINKLFNKKMNLSNFDKNEYIFQKASKTIEIIDRYF
jgi:hypothetical protein